MRLFKKDRPDTNSYGAIKDAEEAINESQRVNKRVNRIVDEYKKTEKVLVDYNKTRRRIKHA